MKYGKHLVQLEESFPAPWRGTMLKYAPLKDRIKECSQPGCGIGDKHHLDQAFFQELEQEVVRINRQFETIAAATLQASRSLSPGSRCSCFPLRTRKKIKMSNGMIMDASPETVAQYCRYCIEYAKANAIALRKIIKKHDKYCHNEKGKEVLAKLWSDQSGQSTFLHSPLLIELAAVEMSALEAREVDVATSPKSTVSNASAASCEGQTAPLQTVTGDMKIDDLRCPICLEVPYKPIALTCSHIFCEDCLFKSCGRGRTLGTTRAILKSISHESQCPQCRQKDVFSNAVVLSETAKMLEARHPSYWAQRRAEVKRHQQELRISYEKRREEEMRGLRGFLAAYLIFS